MAPGDIDRDEICARFLDVVPYTLYPFQEEAILAWFTSEGGVLVSAPTGMGKTLVAEAAVYEALVSGARLYYTTPLIALTDQKFRELQDRAEAWGFQRDDVGLITGNRKVNPDARIRVVVAEILLNHLLAKDAALGDLSAVVMDEFHWFNDPERGVVWELGLTLLPKETRVLLLSATVGNAYDFTAWAQKKHGRKLALVETSERRVPLQYHWVEDRLLHELLVEMGKTEPPTTPALLFCFARDECWEMAERLKGHPLIDAAARAEIEKRFEDVNLARGAGPKLRQMLIRGVGVHHAGVLPMYKELVEELFTARLVPIIVCTETLAAGINLPARSVVISTLLKGKPGARTLIPSATAHQIFGRAGRPQFDTEGHVWAVAHEDDVKIAKWRKKHDVLEAALAQSKEAGLLAARKDLERKKPKRRTTEQYWSEGQFKNLIQAGPGKLGARAMIPYRFLVWLLTHDGDVAMVRELLARRFNAAERTQHFERQLDGMIDNLEALGYVRCLPVAHDASGPPASGVHSEGPHAQDGPVPIAPRSDVVEVDPSAEVLLRFKSVEPLYGHFLARELAQADFTEKLRAVESVLDVPWVVVRAAGEAPAEAGPLQKNVLEPLMTVLGVRFEQPRSGADDAAEEDDFNPWAEAEEKPVTFPEMLRIDFERRLKQPEEIAVQPKWIAGGVLEAAGDFDRFVASRSMQKSEGIVLRHLLRVVLLAAEMFAITEDPDYDVIRLRVTEACDRVDPKYTARMLESARERDVLI